MDFRWVELVDNRVDHPGRYAPWSSDSNVLDMIWSRVERLTPITLILLLNVFQSVSRLGLAKTFSLLFPSTLSFHFFRPYAQSLRILHLTRVRLSSASCRITHHPFSSADKSPWIVVERGVCGVLMKGLGRHGRER